MLEGLGGEEGIADLCRRDGIATSLYYLRSKEFMEAGEKRLGGDTIRLPRRKRCRRLCTNPVVCPSGILDSTSSFREVLKQLRRNWAGDHASRWELPNHVGIEAARQRSASPQRLTVSQPVCRLALRSGPNAHIFRLSC